jgi:molecular chaperone GrpE
VGPAGTADEGSAKSDSQAARVEPETSAEQQRLEQDLDELQETKRERDEYLELAKRTRADFENYRKRVARETEEALARGKAELAAELVPILDNLEQALTAVGIDPGAALAGEVSHDGALEQGVLLTYRELHATLTRAGIEAYDPAGERFDPTWHEALQTRAEEGTDPGTVLEVLQKGYRLDGRVIRAARVVVSD